MLTMAGNNLVEISAEILVQSHSGTPLPGVVKNLGNWPPASSLRAKHGTRPVILFDDNLNPLLHFA